MSCTNFNVTWDGDGDAVGPTVYNFDDNYDSTGLEFIMLVDTLGNATDGVVGENVTINYLGLFNYVWENEDTYTSVSGNYCDEDGGSFWSNTPDTSGSECKTNYTITIPWSNAVNDCNFKISSSSSGDAIYISGLFYMIMVSPSGSNPDYFYFQDVQSTIAINVTFPTQINLFSDDITIQDFNHYIFGLNRLFDTYDSNGTLNGRIEIVLATWISGGIIQLNGTSNNIITSPDSNTSNWEIEELSTNCYTGFRNYCIQKWSLRSIEQKCPNQYEGNIMILHDIQCLNTTSSECTAYNDKYNGTLTQITEINYEDQFSCNDTLETAELERFPASLKIYINSSYITEYLGDKVYKIGEIVYCEVNIPSLSTLTLFNATLQEVTICATTDLDPTVIFDPLNLTNTGCSTLDGIIDAYIISTTPDAETDLTTTQDGINDHIQFNFKVPDSYSIPTGYNNMFIQVSALIEIGTTRRRRVLLQINNNNNNNNNDNPDYVQVFDDVGIDSTQRVQQQIPQTQININNNKDNSDIGNKVILSNKILILLLSIIIINYF